MSDFSYSSWAAYREDTGAQATNTADATEYALWYGEGGNNIDGTLQDHDNDDQFEGVIGSGGSDQANHTTGGLPGNAIVGSRNIAALSFHGTININGTVYPVFQDPVATADFVLFAQSDDELPASITIADIQLASAGATFPFCFMGGTLIATPGGELPVLLYGRNFDCNARWGVEHWRSGQNCRRDVHNR